MFRGVRQAFCDYVVDGGLGCLGKSSRGLSGYLDQERSTVRERLQGGDESAVGEDRRVKAPRQLLELVQRKFQIFAYAFE